MNPVPIMAIVAGFDCATVSEAIQRARGAIDERAAEPETAGLGFFDVLD